MLASQQAAQTTRKLCGHLKKDLLNNGSRDLDPELRQRPFGLDHEDSIPSLYGKTLSAFESALLVARTEGMEDDREEALAGSLWWVLPTSTKPLVGVATSISLTVPLKSNKSG